MNTAKGQQRNREGEIDRKAPCYDGSAVSAPLSSLLGRRACHKGGAAEAAAQECAAQECATQECVYREGARRGIESFLERPIRNETAKAI